MRGSRLWLGLLLVLCAAGCPKTGTHTSGDGDATSAQAHDAVDTDGDGITDVNDACPGEPEDLDAFQDEDGCPEADNDGDGITDVDDACPNEPEVFNGLDDEDGCPDQAMVQIQNSVVLNEDFVEVPVFFGTDRAATGRQEPIDFYGGDRGPLSRGVAFVSIPRGHQAGELESPRWPFSQWEPSQHVMVNNVVVVDEERFHAWIRNDLHKGANEVVVFVHGYNVTFHDAARRAAQVTYDLAFAGVTAMFSWPADGHTASYTRDEADIKYAERHVKRFLLGLLDETGADSVHVIAHSMGNRAVTEVLKELALERPEARFGQVILAAPDVDADVFANDIVPMIRKVAAGVTLYASSGDKALMASDGVHGYPRAGFGGDGLVVIEGLDTVDCSAVEGDLLGHSVFAQAAAMLQDMRARLLGGGAEARAALVQRSKGGRTFWVVPGR